MNKSPFILPKLRERMTTTTKEAMIAKIYEVIADKTLNTGCIIKTNIYKDIQVIQQAFTAGGVKEDRYLGGKDKDALYISLIGYSGDFGEDKIKKVIGHPVMIGDVLDFLYNSERDGKRAEGIGDLREIDLSNLRIRKRNPIEDQSDECISFIYSLLPDAN